MKHERFLPCTTDLDAIKKSANRFTWGRINKFHQIGRYDIVEFQAFQYKSSCRTDELEKKSSFHIYVDGRSSSCSCGSLEGALVYAIALGSLEANEARWMAIAANKTLGLKVD